MLGPRLDIHLGKVRENARRLVQLCASSGVRVMGVTKGVCGMPAVARVMLEAGVSALADSRLPNLERLRRSGLAAPLWMLRIPSPAEVGEVARLCDGSFHSELETLRWLSAAAVKPHRVILMVELGDGREGMLPEEVPAAVLAARQMKNLHVEGLGANLMCFSGVCPTEEALSTLVEMAHSLGLPLVSGGNSASLPLLLSGRLPPGVNHLRLGEAILLGRETVQGTPLPGLHLDAFTLSAAVVEVKAKPALRAVCAIGRQDCRPEGLTPLLPGAAVLGASCDHLVLDIARAAAPVRVGDYVAFHPSYGSLLQAMTSPYVEKYAKM